MNKRGVWTLVVSFFFVDIEMKILKETLMAIGASFSSRIETQNLSLLYGVTSIYFLSSVFVLFCLNINERNSCKVFSFEFVSSSQVKYDRLGECYLRRAVCGDIILIDYLVHNYEAQRSIEIDLKFS